MTQQQTFQIPYYPINRHKEIMHGLLEIKGVYHIDYHKVDKVSGSTRMKYIEIVVKFNDRLIDASIIDDYVRTSMRKM